MNKALGVYSLMVSLVLGCFSASAIASAPVVANIPAAAYAAFTKLDMPVFLYKTTGKDPYFQLYRPGANTLESVLFGYYAGHGVHVRHITNASEQLEFMIPIRWTTLYEDAIVQIDNKGTGYRESVMGKVAEDLFKAVNLLPEHSYKGTPFVDQYVEGIPMKWVFNKAAELTSLRRYLEPMFERAQLLAKGISKPALIIDIESAKNIISQEDSDFLNKYFTMVDPINDAVKLFFENHQKRINLAVLKIKDAKQVKEGFFEMLFRNAESVTKEGKAKEFGVVVISTLVSAITIGVIQEHMKEVSKDAHNHAKKHVGVVVDRLRENHDLRNGMLIGGGILGAGLVGAAIYAETTE